MMKGSPFVRAERTLRSLAAGLRVHGAGDRLVQYGY